MQEKRAFAAAEVVTGGCLLVTGGKAGDGRVSDTMEVTAYTAHRPHFPQFPPCSRPPGGGQQLQLLDPRLLQHLPQPQVP